MFFVVVDGKPTSMEDVRFAHTKHTQTHTNTGADVHRANEDGDQPLHYAAYEGHTDVALALMRAGVVSACVFVSVFCVSARFCVFVFVFAWRVFVFVCFYCLYLSKTFFFV